tara:strand:- start:677 stop:1384 length:708 start_codon:yes stop_codon:yes gene_type:complete
VKHLNSYHEIKHTTQKAILVQIRKEDKNAVWFPLSRIDLYASDKTIAATKKLWGIKNSEANSEEVAQENAERESKREENNSKICIADYSCVVSKAHGWDIEKPYIRSHVMLEPLLNGEFVGAVDKELAYFKIMSECPKEHVTKRHFYVPKWLAEIKYLKAAHDYYTKTMAYKFPNWKAHHNFKVIASMPNHNSLSMIITKEDLEEFAQKQRRRKEIKEWNRQKALAREQEFHKSH